MNEQNEMEYPEWLECKLAKFYGRAQKVIDEQQVHPLKSLRVVRRKVDRTAVIDTNKQCPECGKWFHEDHIHWHMTSVHSSEAKLGRLIQEGLRA